MLLQFSVKNYKTFKDKATLSLIASNYDKGTREEDNIFTNEKYGLRILKSAVVYGANASGKSKLFEAFVSIKRFVIESSKESQRGELIPIQPFLLSNETENEPSEFEVIFIFNNIMYRYGFEATKNKIITEWLYYKPVKKEIELFYRDGNSYDTHKKLFTKGGNIAAQGFVRDNALLLSTAAQFNETKAIAVIDWFFSNMNIISGLNESGYRSFTLKQMESTTHKTKILELLRAADLGIQDIKLQKMEISAFPEEVREKITKKWSSDISKIVKILTLHKKYDSYKNFIDYVVFSLADEESSGTEKFFFLAGPVLDTLENGLTLVVDELDSKLHPNLVRELVLLFNSKKNNKKAQLIFNTHDTNLFSAGLFRRDQFWFTEKNRYGEAKLYSLADFKSNKVRNGESYEDNYIKGKYGAIPFLGFFDDLNNLSHENEK